LTFFGVRQSRIMQTRPWTLQPWCVYGGWRLAWARWVFIPNGWDQEYEPFAGDEVLYASEPAAAEAVARALEAGCTFGDISP
jgi:hypothetical protein